MFRSDFFNLSLNSESDEDFFSQSQRNFYPKIQLNIESNQPSAPNLMNNISGQINENFEDWEYLEDTENSLNYIAKPILGGDLYEFTCEENHKKFLAKIKNCFDTANEKELLKQLSHNNILQLEKNFSEDLFETYMLYEYCGNITLKQYLEQSGTLPEYEVKFIITELINLLIYSKSENIIHTNLGLNNIIMTKRGGIKVMGFDSAIKLNYGKNNYICKDCWFHTHIFSPESFIDKSENRFFSYESDLWALGRIMYTLLIGSGPNIDNSTDMKKFLKKKKGISPEALDCLRRILEPNPKKRHKLNQIFLLPFFKTK